MRYSVKLIVQAKNEQEALRAAMSDAFLLVDIGEFERVDVIDNLGDSQAYDVTSHEGIRLIREGMDKTRQIFNDGMTAVKYMLENFTDDDIYNENFSHDDHEKAGTYLSKHRFLLVSGEYKFSGIYAMNGHLWGSKVDNEKDLNEILSRYSYPDRLWVVPVDFID